MARRGKLAWTDLRVGLFVLGGIALVVVAIFYVTASGVGGAKYKLVTYLPEADGLAIGAPVTLDGVQVGNVDRVTVAPPQNGQQPPPQRSVEVIMRVSRDFQNYIRSDSDASLITQGFLGDREVTLKRGYTGRVLQNGDEVNGVGERGLQQIADTGAALMQNLNMLSEKITAMVDQVQSGEGTLGKLLVDQSLYNRMNDTLRQVDQITTSVQQGQGTIGKLLTSEQLYDQMNSITGHVDNMLEAVQSQKGTLGKIVYNPDIHDSTKEFLDNTNALLAGVREGHGTLGKLATDDSLFTAYRETGQNLSQLTSKVNSNQGTVGKLMNNPELYDNLVGLTGDMRLLLGEFRKNPKKFLKIRLSMF